MRIDIYEQDCLRLEAIQKMCEMVLNYRDRLYESNGTHAAQVHPHENIAEVLGAIGKVSSQLTFEVKYFSRYEVMWGSVQSWQYVCPFLYDVMADDALVKSVFSEILLHDIFTLLEKVEIMLALGYVDDDCPEPEDDGEMEDENGITEI